MKKKSDLSDFKCGIIVGARQAGLKISKLLICGQKWLLDVRVE